MQCRHTHVKANEAQGTAGVKQKSKAEVGHGFSWGLDQMVNASKSASPMPNGITKNTGRGSDHRPGVWHPAAERP